MGKSLEKLQRDLEAAQRELADAEERLAMQATKHEAVERKLADSRKIIERAHQEWETAMDAVRDPIFLHDKDFRILRCNRAYQRRAGIPFKRIIGKPFYKVFPKAEGPPPGRAEEMAWPDSAEELTVDDAVYLSRAFPVRDDQGDYLYSVYVLEDTTDRKQAEKSLKRGEAKLREGEELFRSIATAAIDGILMVDDEGRITYWNPAAAAMFGYERGEVLGRNLHELLAPARYREAHRKAFPEFAATGAGPVIGKTLELSALRKDGREFPIELSVSALRREGRWHAVGLMRDITERKRVEESLRSSRDLLESIVENIPVRVFWKDRDLRYLGCNSLFARDAGKSGPQDLIGKDDYQMGWSEQAELYRADDQEVMDLDTEKLGYEEPQTTPDGHKIWLRTSKVPLHGVAGEVLGMLGIYEDITDRKAAETALRDSERRFRDLVENSSDWIWEVDADGVYTYSSPKGEDLLGYSTDEIVGRTPFDFMPTDEAKRVREIFHGIVEERRPFSGIENTNLRKDGTEVIFETSGVPILSEAGEFSGYRGIDRDVTERNWNEELMRRSEASLAEAQRIAKIGSWSLELATGQLTWSDEIYRIFEIDPERFDATYDAFLEVIHPDDRAMVDSTYRDHLNAGAPYEIEHRLLFKDGRVKYVQERCQTTFDGDEPVRSLGTVQDITDRRLADISLARYHRALNTLSAGNKALVHAGEEAALLRDMCHAIVDEGGYRLAWVGLVAHDEGKAVRPVADAGYEEGYLETLEITWADTERGQGPTGRAVRLGTPQVAEDILVDPKFEPWRAQARRRGYASSIALPLKDRDGAVFAILNIYAVEAHAFDEAEITLLQELAEDLAFGILARRTADERNRFQEENLRHESRLKNSLLETIHAIALMVEKRDPYTSGHQDRVAILAVAIGREMGLDEHRLEGLRLGATIHDIGKVYVPAEILNRPGKLSEAEFEMVKSHPSVGYDIIKGVDLPWPVAEMVLQHHERMDESGYPNGIGGEEIVPEARIIAVADVVEAICSHRPYRPSLGIEIALAEIESNAGTTYDADAVAACLRLFREKRFEPEHWISEIEAD